LVKYHIIGRKGKQRVRSIDSNAHNLCGRA